MIPIIAGVLLVVATIAFITVPYALARHPWEPAAMVVGTVPSLHLN
jgi:hypothetical protein